MTEVVEEIKQKNIYQLVCEKYPEFKRPLDNYLEDECFLTKQVVFNMERGRTTFDKGNNKAFVLNFMKINNLTLND